MKFYILLYKTTKKKKVENRCVFIESHGVLDLFGSHSNLGVTMYHHKQKKQIFISHYIYIRLE